MQYEGRRIGRVLVQKRRGLTVVTVQAPGARGGFTSLGAKFGNGEKPGDILLSLVDKELVSE